MNADYIHFQLTINNVNTEIMLKSETNNFRLEIIDNNFVNRRCNY